MHIVKKLVPPALFIAAFGSFGQCMAEDSSLRERLAGLKSIGALYSIDQHTTFITASGSGALIEGISSVCSSYSLSLVERDGRHECPGLFEASLAGPADGAESYMIRSAEPQPVIYMNPLLPAMEELEAPREGRLSAGLTSIDAYQYLYALCQKTNGAHSLVVSKRSGRYARLVEVAPEEGFRHLMASGDGKDPWFFGCDGSSRFLAEKEYQYSPDGERKYLFHANRGIEWIDYVKAGEKEKIARLDGYAVEAGPGPSERAETASRMARELSAAKEGFVVTSSGARYEGHYNGNRKRAGCGLVSVKYTSLADSQEVYNFEVCGSRVALVDRTITPKALGGAFASLGR